MLARPSRTVIRAGRGEGWKCAPQAVAGLGPRRPRRAYGWKCALWPEGPGALQRLPDARRRERHACDLDAAVGQRILDRVGDCRYGRDDAALADALHAELVAGRRKIERGDIERRHLI